VRDEIMGKSAKDLDFVVLGNLNAGIDFSMWLSNKLGNYKEAALKGFGYVPILVEN
jgi:hypothetical protein